MGKPKRYMTIGEMARACCTTPRALRIYQQRGLVEPAYVDEQTGNRFYDIDQARLVSFIHRLQDIGFSLDEIVDVCTSSDLSELERLADAHLEQLRSEIRRLVVTRAVAEELVAGCRCRERVLYDQIVLERLPPSRIVTFDLPREIPTDESGRLTFLTWKWLLLHFRREAIGRGYPRVAVRNFSCIVSFENVLAGSAAVSSVYLDVTRFPEEEFPDAKVVEKGMCLTMRRDNGNGPEGHGIGAWSLPRMLDYARAKNLRPCGDFYEETLFKDSYLLTGRDEVDCLLALPVESAG